MEELIYYVEIAGIVAATIVGISGIGWYLGICLAKYEIRHHPERHAIILI